MPSSVGPNTFGEENLVFGYDLGDNKNSFPGIPAVNCATVPANGFNWTVTEVTDGSISPPRKGARVFKFVCNNTSNLHRQGGYYSGGGFGGSNPNPLILGKTSPSNFTTVGTGKYRFGMWVRGAASNSTAWWTIDIGDRNGSNITVNNNTDWQFVSTTDAAGIASTSYPYDFFDINGTNGQTYYVADYGIFRSPGTVDSLPALQAYPQWVDFQQTRSYTGGLKDLTGNSTIDLTNVSFDSNAQMTFDGSNDYATLSSASHPTGSCSMEIVFNHTHNFVGSRYLLYGANGTAFWVFFRGDWAGNLLYFTRRVTNSGNYGDSAWGYTTGIYQPVPANETMHLIFTHDAVSGEFKSYKNGILTRTVDGNLAAYGALNTTQQSHYLGGSPGDNLPMTLPLFKFYDRVLTASEIQSNYNAIKGRFNI